MPPPAVNRGKAVSKVKGGDWVVLPFNIACGFCKQCEQGLTNYCLTMQPKPDMAGAAYGFAEMGPYQGGQAELLRVPYGDFNALRLGEDAAERQLDYVMLADIFPTGYHATEMAGVKPGDQTIVYGAGPVGLMAAYSAILKGAGRVWVADHQPDRLGLAEEIGAIAIDTAEQDPPRSSRKPPSAWVRTTAANASAIGPRPAGTGGRDPDHERAHRLGPVHRRHRCGRRVPARGPGRRRNPGRAGSPGEVPLDFGMLWFKGQRIGTGQAPVKRYNRALRDLIADGRAEPSFLVSHELSLDEASSAYEHFDNRDDGWTKVVLHPNGSSRSAGGSSRHTLQELRQEAKAQGIEGRSHMNKEQLERALRR